MPTIEQRLSDLALAGARAAIDAGTLPVVDVPGDAAIARARRAEWGDYATALALQLAAAARRPPLAVAEAIAAHLPAADLVARASVSPPGFLNFALSPSWLAARVPAIRAAGESYADLDLGAGRKAQVEYVSANPTGPLTVGHGRTGVIGDTMAHLLAAAGWDVTREYYYNDAGKQMRLLGESLRARYLQALGEPVELPEGGYQGDYLVRMGEELVASRGREMADLSWEAFRDIAESRISEGQRLTMDRLGIHMDVYFNEASLYADGSLDACLATLREHGFAYEADGAVWLRATALGGPEDRVIVRANGEPTYRLPDIAYHAHKLARGFDLVVDVLGADHKDAFPDVLRGLRALGHVDPPVVLLMNQFVTFRGGRMSKRAGHFTTLDDLLDEVGADVARYFLLMRAAETHLEFDLDLALEQSEKNPVYYVQYAHARTASILRLAAERGLAADDAQHALLAHPSELALIRRLLELSSTIATATTELAPHHVTTYARDLAGDFHAFYRDCRVLDPDAPELSSARLALVDAARIGLARTLALAGVSAPEAM